jgi:hypothetical protein
MGGYAMRTLLALLCLLLPLPALACEPLPNPKPIPSNIELLRDADLVVLARVESEGSSNSVILKPVAALKGQLPDQSLTAPGTTSERDGSPYPQQVTSLDEPHPSWRWGSCVRQAYFTGGLVLALYGRHASGYGVFKYPWARNIEDVRDAEDLWPRAARLYLKVLAEPDPDAAFAATAKQLEAKKDADSQAIAADIRRYLANRQR